MAKILIVEDDPMISEIYQRKFESSNFEVVVAATGKEALKKAREENFNIVLLDMILPEMNGLDVLKEYKRSGKYNSEMRVIIFSNLSEKESQDKAFEYGADAYILKSQFGPSELVAEVNRLLNIFDEQKKNGERLENKLTQSDESNGKKRILFIEDEDIFLEMFGKKLEDEGYFVEYAENGAVGLKEALSKDFDLIITDMVMPAVMGKEIIERLKLEEGKKNIPIIAFSASLDNEEIKDVKNMGIEEFFVKTRIVPSDLAKRVKEILGD
jgi:DNA-binding response OmpR family regulator